VENAEQSLTMLRGVPSNEAGAARDIVAMNAGAAIYVAGLSDTLEAGITRAQEVIASGAALEKLTALSEKSNS
jgi:anthranilate phosphoribosyltransferase